MLAKKKENVSRSAAALTSKTPFQIVEAYKAIRANLLFILSTAAEKAVVVTSAEPSAVIRKVNPVPIAAHRIGCISFSPSFPLVSYS